MRLIDADEMRNGWIDGINEPIYCANDVLDDIDKQPTVDAVEVVRCKDCNYRTDVDESHICGVCKRVVRYRNDEDFCSNGELRNEVKK